jgi:indole-3-glycerol phosphate synthase
VNDARRLSQAISEGDGISVLAEVRDGSSARAAEDQGAEGLVLRGLVDGVREVSQLPVLVYGPSLRDAADSAADAVVLAADVEDDRLVELAEQASALGLEVVLKVRDEEDFERVLEHLDPEIFLLSAEDADDEESPLARLLELLPDVPAGKLAIAELAAADRLDVEELERAGVDAVLVSAGEIGPLVGDVPPEV